MSGWIGRSVSPFQGNTHTRRDRGPCCRRDAQQQMLLAIAHLLLIDSPAGRAGPRRRRPRPRGGRGGRAYAFLLAAVSWLWGSIGVSPRASSRARRSGTRAVAVTCTRRQLKPASCCRSKPVPAAVQPRLQAPETKPSGRHRALRSAHSIDRLEKTQGGRFVMRLPSRGLAFTFLVPPLSPSSCRSRAYSVLLQLGGIDPHPVKWVARRDRIRGRWIDRSVRYWEEESIFCPWCVAGSRDHVPGPHTPLRKPHRGSTDKPRHAR